MKVTTNTGSEVAGFDNTAKFGVEAGAMLFNALSSTIYSDKIGSMIREVFSNAYDEFCKPSTSNTPIKVTLPTEYVSRFEVRDYGTGITEEDIYNVYGVYFKSTKRDSDAEIGGFGIGAKSPFAYSDNFTVDSYVDGKKISYLMFKDENGEPGISKMGEEDTDEPNGLCVSIATEAGDKWTFQRKGRELLERFPAESYTVNTDVDPITYIGGFDCGLARVNVISSSIETKEYNRAVSWNIVLENIKYATPHSTVNMNIDLPLNMELDISFKTGTLSPSLSRETLEMNKSTTAAIDEVYSKIPALLTDWMLGELKNFPKLKQAVIVSIVKKSRNKAKIPADLYTFKDMRKTLVKVASAHKDNWRLRTKMEQFEEQLIQRIKNGAGNDSAPSINYFTPESKFAEGLIARHTKKDYTWIPVEMTDATAKAMNDALDGELELLNINGALQSRRDAEKARYSQRKQRRVPKKVLFEMNGVSRTNLSGDFNDIYDSTKHKVVFIRHQAWNGFDSNDWVNGELIDSYNLRKTRDAMKKIARVLAEDDMTLLLFDTNNSLKWQKMERDIMADVDVVKVNPKSFLVEHFTEITGLAADDKLSPAVIYGHGLDDIYKRGYDQDLHKFYDNDKFMGLLEEEGIVPDVANQPADATDKIYGWALDISEGPQYNAGDEANTAIIASVKEFISEDPLQTLFFRDYISDNHKEF